MLAPPASHASHYRPRYKHGNCSYHDSLYTGSRELYDSRYPEYRDQQCDEHQTKDGGDYCDDDVHSEAYSYGSHSDDYSYGSYSVDDSYGSIEDDYSADDYSTGSYEG